MKMSSGGGVYKLWYREQFLSGSCHVCKKECPMKMSCQECGLVLYCSTSHLEQDMEEHEEICMALASVAERLGVTRVMDKAYLLDAEAYRQFRGGVMSLCAEELARPLRPWEQELVLFPPVCATCRRLDGVLHLCTECRLARWCCPAHRPRSHDDHCPQLALYRHLAELGVRTLAVPPLAGCPPPDMAALATDPVELALLSEVATCPLSVHHCLRLQPSQDNFVVHVVGAEPAFEASNLRKWDDFLCDFLEGSLTIVFIGPEIGKLPCRRLTKDGRILEYVFKNCLYHDYVGARPHLVAAFNPGLYRRTGFDSKDTWTDTIHSVFRRGAPFLVTAYTKKEIKADLKRVASEVSEVKEVIPPQVNPWASKRPLMNFVSDEKTPVIFKNAYYMLLNV